MAKNKQGVRPIVKRVKQGIVIITVAGVIFVSAVFASMHNKLNFRPEPDLDTSTGISAPGDVEADQHTVAPHPSINTETEGNHYIETSTSSIHTGNEPTINTETESNTFIPQETERDVVTDHEVVTESPIGAGNVYATESESYYQTETEYYTETHGYTEIPTEYVTERHTETDTHPVHTEAHTTVQTEAYTHPAETERETEVATSAPVENTSAEQIVSKLIKIAKNYIKKATGTSKDPDLTNLIISEITPNAKDCMVSITGTAYLKNQCYTIEFILNTTDNTLAIYNLVNNSSSPEKIDSNECLNAINELIDHSYNNKFKLTGKVNEYEEASTFSK